MKTKEFLVICSVLLLTSQVLLAYLGSMRSANQGMALLCVQVVGGQDAKAVKDTLATEHGIMVRHYAKKELSGYIRISVGRPEDTQKLLAALRGMCRPGGSNGLSTTLEKE